MGLFVAVSMAFKLAYENVIIGLQSSFLFIDLFKIFEMKFRNVRCSFWTTDETFILNYLE